MFSKPFSRGSFNQLNKGQPLGISMPMDVETPLIAPLEDRLIAFLRDELDFVLWQAAKLEGAMKFHQAQMKDVCHAIQAHYYWANFEPCFPDGRQCKRCGTASLPSLTSVGTRAFASSGRSEMRRLLLLTVTITCSRTAGSKLTQHRTGGACYPTSRCASAQSLLALASRSSLEGTSLPSGRSAPRS